MGGGGWGGGGGVTAYVVIGVLSFSSFMYCTCTFKINLHLKTLKNYKLDILHVYKKWKMKKMRHLSQSSFYDLVIIPLLTIRVAICLWSKVWKNYCAHISFIETFSISMLSLSSDKRIFFWCHVSFKILSHMIILFPNPKKLNTMWIINKSYWIKSFLKTNQEK